MPAKIEIPSNCELVIASDVHIREPWDASSRALIALLDAALVAKPKALVLNGDIFDFFFGWGSYFRQKHREIFDRMERLAKTGTEVWFVEGNHEFGMQKMAVKGMRVVDSFGDILTTASGTRVLIVHGDLMRHDPAYLTFRAVARSTFLSVVASCIPQRWLDAWTLWFATTSRKKDRYRTLNHESILANAEKTLRTSGADHLVFGHFHHPYDHTTADGKRILSVDSWMKPSFLVFDAGRFVRCYF